MKTRFYGSSDDLVEIEGDIPMLNGMDEGLGRAEWNVSKTPAIFNIVGEVRECATCKAPTLPEHLASVIAFYDGTWFFALSMADEGKMIPEHWSIKTISEHDYSTALVIDTGDDKVSIMAP